VKKDTCKCGRPRHLPRGKADCSSKCLECRLEAGRKWRAANKQKMAEYQRNYRVANLAKLQQDKAAWHQSNRDKAKARWEAIKADPEKYAAYKASSKASRERRRDKIRVAMAAKKYKISKERAAELYSSVSCAICNEPTKTICIDHCHKTGKVRGGLCTRCNVTLGYIEGSRHLIGAMLGWINRGGDEA